jgi:hypothetical protein
MAVLILFLSPFDFVDVRLADFETASAATSPSALALVTTS